MDIIDTQVHIWTADRLALVSSDSRRPWLWIFEGEPVTIEVQHAAMNAVGVTATVIAVPAGLYGRQRADGFVEYDNGYAEEAAKRYPGRFYSVGFADPVAPDVDDAVADLAARPGVVGIRQRVGHGDGLDEITQGQWNLFFRSVAEHGLPVFVAAEGVLESLHQTIQRHDDVQFIIDHFGLPVPQVLPPDSGRPFDQLPSLLELAKFPNVAVKWGGAQRLSEEPYPFEDIWPHMHRVVDAFGVDRLMFASDWTVCRDLHSYGEAVFCLRDTDELSETEKAAIFAGTARRILGIPADQR